MHKEQIQITTGKYFHVSFCAYRSRALLTEGRHIVIFSKAGREPGFSLIVIRSVKSRRFSPEVRTDPSSGAERCAMFGFKAPAQSRHVPTRLPCTAFRGLAGCERGCEVASQAPRL